MWVSVCVSLSVLQSVFFFASDFNSWAPINIQFLGSDDFFNVLHLSRVGFRVFPWLWRLPPTPPQPKHRYLIFFEHTHYLHITQLYLHIRWAQYCGVDEQSSSMCFMSCFSLRASPWAPCNVKFLGSDDFFYVLPLSCVFLWFSLGSGDSLQLFRYCWYQLC